ncbi:MAG: O-antigen ligase family protein [Deltaproteobacteria bacterium]|nr:O-antigen ligase family protein [Deltaproteobacteria bacterium]
MSESTSSRRDPAAETGRRQRRSRARGPRGPFARVSEGAVVLTLFLAPLALGSVHLWATALELLGVGLAAAGLLLALRGGGRLVLPRWATLGLGLLLGLEALQLLPLPPALLELLAPRSAELLAYSLGDLGAWPAWRPVSLDPAATALEVARHATFFLLFLVVTQLARSRHGRRRIALYLGALAALLVVLAFGQKLARLELIYGVFPVPPRGFLFASFVNPNHLAALLGLLAPLCLGLAFGARTRPLALLWGAVFVGVSITCVLTLSRGGMVGWAVGLAVFALLQARLRGREALVAEDRRPLRARGWPLGLALVGVVAVLSGVAYLALEPVLAELQTLGGEEALSGEMRLAIWRDGRELIQGHWLTGVGRGAWALTFPVYRTIARVGTFSHAESQPVQALAELGLIGGTLFVLVFAFLLVQGARVVASPRGAGVVAGLAALGVHELADFSTVFGGVAIPATLALTLACRGRQRGEGEEATKRELGLGRLPALALLGGVALLGAAGLGLASRGLADADLAALQEGELETPVFLERAREAQRRHPTDHMVALVAARTLAERGEEVAAMRWVSRAMYLSPTEPLAHLLAAILLTRAGQREQALLEYRLAARWGHPIPSVLASAERSFPALEDLARALPEEERARTELANYLARRERWADLLEIATRSLEVWPDSADLLALAATAARSEGEAERALELATRLQALAPLDPRGPLLLARIHRGQNDLAAAGAVLQQGLARLPGDPTLSLELTRLLLTTGDLEGADEALARASGLRGRGQRATYHLLRGQLLARQGEPERALEAYRLAARQNEESAAAPIAMGDLLRELGRPAEAAEAYEQALERTRGAQRQRIQRRLESLDAPREPPPPAAGDGR